MQLSCAFKCRRSAGDASKLYLDAKAKCAERAGSGAKACEQVVTAEQSMHRAYCHAGKLPTTC